MSVQNEIDRLLNRSHVRRSAFYEKGKIAAENGMSIFDNPYSSAVNHHGGGVSISEWNEDEWRRGFLENVRPTKSEG